MNIPDLLWVQIYSTDKFTCNKMELISTSFQPLPHLKNFFPPDLPTGIRCQAVLNGDALGRILLDNPVSPEFVFLQEFSENTLFPGGSYTADQLARAIDLLRQDTEVILGLWPEDPLAVPKYPFPDPKPEYLGAAIDLTDRDPTVDLETLAQIPKHCELRPIDLPFFERIDHAYEIRAFGSLDIALQKGFGCCLIQQDEVLSHAFAAPVVNGEIEIGISTVEAHRQKGFATVTCANLIKECERLGYRPFWNSAAQNTASLNLAVKLGFSTERPYRVYWWSKSKL